MNQKFLDFVQPFLSARMAVAVSGGVDSVALLHWLVAAGADVVVLHVNHGLRAAATAEEEYVRETAARLGVPCHVFHWNGDKPAAGLEAAARTARYRMMTDFCRANGLEYLAVAHQADDQIETFLMNLARGSGVAGLSGMRAVTVRDGVKILRPLLGVPRAALEKYCNDNNIRYFHDEMNDDARYMRVRIRKNRHVLRDMLGISDERILLAMRNLGRARDAAAVDVNAAVESVMDGDRAIFSDSFLFDLGADIGLQFIAALIMKIGGGEYQPRLKSLESALDKLTSDCKFTLGGCVVRRLGDKILIAREGARTSFRKRHESKHKK